MAEDTDAVDTAPEDNIEKELLKGLDDAAKADAEVPQEHLEADEDDNTRHTRWQSKRPRIDHLEDGVVTTDGMTLPLFEEGQRIVVDCRTDLLKNTPWL